MAIAVTPSGAVSDSASSAAGRAPGVRSLISRITGSASLAAAGAGVPV